MTPCGSPGSFAASPAARRSARWPPGIWAQKASWLPAGALIAVLALIWQDSRLFARLG